MRRRRAPLQHSAVLTEGVLRAMFLRKVKLVITAAAVIAGLAAGAVSAQFNTKTGNIAFRADFSNPGGLLRQGQTGTILMHRKVHDAIVIPMRATYEILDKRYVYVVDNDDVAHQRQIVVQDETDDIFV